MDWRELASRPTIHTAQRSWSSWHSVWSGGKEVGSGSHLAGQWDGLVDPRRGWIIAVCWIAASGAEYVWHTYVNCVRNLTMDRIASITCTPSFDDPA